MQFRSHSGSVEGYLSPHPLLTPSPILNTTIDCDLLVHEATYDARYPKIYHIFSSGSYPFRSMKDKAIATGHSTTAMAGEFARQVFTLPSLLC